MYTGTTRLFDTPLCFVDVETTGASFDYGDRVVELGILRIEGGQVTAEYQQLLDPGRPMSGGAAAITGITPAMLAGQPRFCDIWPAACELLTGAVVIGHNVLFDIAFLAGECRKAGGAICDRLGDLHVLDTVRIARKQLGRRGNGLQRLADRFGYVPTVAHRALGDCHTTAFLLRTLLEPHGGWEIALDRAHELQGGFNSLAVCTRARESALPTEIADALVAGVPVQISYLDATNKRTDRAVTPKFVRRLRGHLMLFAHCHARNEQRTFKLDRILSAVPMVEASQLSMFPGSD